MKHVPKKSGKPLNYIPIRRIKLGRAKAWGLSAGNGTIEIDQRLKGKKELEIITHEVLHELFPELAEEVIVHKSIILTNTLWREHYRKIDNHEGDKLQDGTK